MKQRLLFILSTLSLLLVLAACGPGSTTNTATSVQVTEIEYHIASSLYNFSPGTTYHFVVTNKGMIAHEFMIMPRSEGSMSGMPMSHMDTLALASIDNINPGETKTLDYTFPSSATNSHPEFACYLAGHYEAGMRQGVIVKAEHK
jgi:uncharacterized cupredoxin-like copper-binding protein